MLICNTRSEHAMSIVHQFCHIAIIFGFPSYTHDIDRYIWISNLFYGIVLFQAMARYVKYVDESFNSTTNIGAINACRLNIFTYVHYVHFITFAKNRLDLLSYHFKTYLQTHG